jgi:hypothetical protein
MALYGGIYNHFLFLGNEVVRMESVANHFASPDGKYDPTGKNHSDESILVALVG